MLRIGVEEAPNHPLILRVVLPRLGLEEVDATLAQRDGDLDPFVPEDEILRQRQKVTDDSQGSQRLIRVSDSRAHRSSSLFAKSRRQRRASVGFLDPSPGPIRSGSPPLTEG